MSEIRANTISDAAGTGPVTLTGQYAAKAWVNFNGTGTVAIRESGNVSSITDNGTGDYTVNFTTALTDANYSLAGIPVGGNLNDAGRVISVKGTPAGGASNKTTTVVSILTGVTIAGGPLADLAEINITITR